MRHTFLGSLAARILVYEPVLVTGEFRGKSVRDFFFFKFYFYNNGERPVGRQAFFFWTCVCLHVT